MCNTDPRAVSLPNHIGDLDYQDLILHPVYVASAINNSGHIKENEIPNRSGAGYGNRNAIGNKGNTRKGIDYE